MIKPLPSVVLRAVLAGAALVAFDGAARAGDWPHAHQRANPERSEVDPHRSQRQFIRDGLGPGFLPYIGLGRKHSPRAFPQHPLLHPPIPPGPGDSLYETGRFPWQRG